MEMRSDCLEKKNDIIDEEKIVLPGFRFHPTDEELVTFYLRRKVENKSISIEIIKEIDVYKFDPWDLPKVSSVGGEKEWYFFSLRGRKYRNSIRPNRVTGSGFWKATGIDRPIMNSGSDNSDSCIGLKKSLVYYIGSAGKGKKTDWMMHEFRLPSNSKDSDTCSPSMQEAEIWTICRIFKRNVSSKKTYKQSASSPTQTPTDSSSKTNSVDSDHTNTNSQDQQSLLTPNQIYAAQYINHPFILQSPPTTTNFLYPHPNNNFMESSGNWDELGRMVDYSMMDHMTSASQDCPFY